MQIPMLVLMALCVSGCTIESHGAELKKELHPPLTYAQWEQKKSTTNSGEAICVVTSGHNGISVVTRRKPSGVLGILVKSNRELLPGSTFSISVGGKNFKTSEEYFPAGRSVEIMQTLSEEGGKAYLEWSEVHSDKNHSRVRSSNIVKLEGFTSKFNECKRSFLGKSKPD